MKRFLRAILIIAILCILALTLTACVVKDTEKTTTENKTNTVENTTENTVNETETNGKEIVPDNTDEGKEFTRGKWIDNKYINDFADIKFNLPTGWEKYTDEEIAKLMNVGIEQLNGDQKELLENSGSNSVYGMVVNDPSSGASAMILFENTIFKVTPEYYLSSVKTQLEEVESFYYTIGDIYEKKLAGNTYSAMDAEVSGTVVKQYYLVRTIDNYVVAMIITTTQDGQLDTVLNCFEK